jgi:hypothetical protein
VTMEAVCLRLPREAAQAKVACFRNTIMTFCKDMIDLEGQPVAILRHLAVFTAMTCPLPYQFLQRAFHACSMRPWLIPTLDARAFDRPPRL